MKGAMENHIENILFFFKFSDIQVSNKETSFTGLTNFTLKRTVQPFIRRSKRGWLPSKRAAEAGLVLKNNHAL
jgi:phage portal protein BeeE